jgi:threonine dehydrogenase-like Zn-dependent dehydrogenase
VDPRHAAFIEPLACSLHAVELGNIQEIQNFPSLSFTEYI